MSDDKNKEIVRRSKELDNLLRKLFLESYTNLVSVQSMKIYEGRLSWRPHKYTGAQPETAEELNKHFLNFVCEMRTSPLPQYSINHPVIKLYNGLISVADKHQSNKGIYDLNNEGVMAMAWKKAREGLEKYKETYESLNNISNMVNIEDYKKNMYVHFFKSYGDGNKKNDVLDSASIIFLIISLIMELIILDVEESKEKKRRLNGLKDVFGGVDDITKLSELHQNFLPLNIGQLKNIVNTMADMKLRYFFPVDEGGIVDVQPLEE